MHCWHQKVTVEKAQPGDAYGDISADTEKSFQVYQEWKALSEAPEKPPENLRRPKWFARSVRPSDSAYYLPEESNK